jgi:hypothetical protein
MYQVVDRIAPNTAWPALSIRSITIAVAAICVVLTLWTRPMSFKEFPMESLVGFIAKLWAIAFFVERFVEVLLTPWREPERHRMTVRLKQAKAKHENGQPDSAGEISNCENDLCEYKGQTMQIAFLVALALGMTISAFGLRGLEFFVDPNSMRTCTSSMQMFVFRGLDVLVTGALLAGKAEGLHKMISVFTSQLDKAAERVKSAA